MLTKRIIPCLDVDDGRVVKGVSLVDLRDAGDPAELAYFYDSEGSDELVFLDITASSDNRNTMVEVVQSVSNQVFIPLTVGGGIRAVKDVRKMLEAGADKVSLNTAAINNPSLIYDASKYFGSQCIVVAIDAKAIDRSQIDLDRYDEDSHDLLCGRDSRWEVYTHGGRNPAGFDVVKWAKRVADMGAGEILLTSMDSDGHEQGYDLELLDAVTNAVNIPVIASGGAGTLDHMLHALVEGGADAVLAASIFHFGTYTISEAKDFLRFNNIPVRPISREKI